MASNRAGLSSEACLAGSWRVELVLDHRSLGFQMELELLA